MYRERGTWPQERTGFWPWHSNLGLCDSRHSDAFQHAFAFLLSYVFVLWCWRILFPASLYCCEWRWKGNCSAEIWNKGKKFLDFWADRIWGSLYQINRNKNKHFKKMQLINCVCGVYMCEHALCTYTEARRQCWIDQNGNYRCWFDSWFVIRVLELKLWPSWLYSKHC